MRSDETGNDKKASIGRSPSATAGGATDAAQNIHSFGKARNMIKKYVGKRPAAVLSVWLLLLCLLAALAVVPAGATDTTAGTARISGNPAEVLVGGMPFGAKFYTEGVLVVGFCDVTRADGKTCNPAREAGLHPRDVITHLGGKPLADAAELTAAVENSAGRPLTLTVRRPDGGGSATVQVTPMLSGAENRYKTGIWIRDSGAGIGTVTFIIPAGVCGTGTRHLRRRHRRPHPDAARAGDGRDGQRH